jgi:hypothetical protein
MLPPPLGTIGIRKEEGEKLMTAVQEEERVG